MDDPLDTKIRAALDARRGQWPQIAERCDVSHSWISQFVRNKIPNPGYVTLRRLEADLFPDLRQANLGPAARRSKSTQGA